MSLSVTEANAVNRVLSRLLEWELGTSTASEVLGWSRCSDRTLDEAIVLLADHANRKLMAGLLPDRVAEALEAERKDPS